MIELPNTNGFFFPKRICSSRRTSGPDRMRLFVYSDGGMAVLFNISVSLIVFNISVSIFLSI